MVDPLSATAIGAVVLTEGIKFLYNQAGELLKRYRERKEGATAAAGPEPLLRLPAALVQGESSPALPDYAVLGQLEQSLRDARRSLADFAEGIATPRADDRLLADQI